ncbi:sulfite exporter TauE/SafE family protein [Bordetella holmesii 70147]|nr:sulfite exporter TauE/SafE family protein [Bordetella holmesii 70147]
MNWALLRPALISSLVGVALGVAALDLIHGRLSVILQWLLGLTILVCAFMLVMQARQLAQISSRRVFLSFGLVSGLLGDCSPARPTHGVSVVPAAAALAVIHNSLLVLFAANAVVRLSLVTWQGSIHVNTLWMSLEALPVVVILTMLVRRFASAHAIRSVKRMVFVLLIAAGLGLFVPPRAPCSR